VKKPINRNPMSKNENQTKDFVNCVSVPI
jgi:hypothetical protein